MRRPMIAGNWKMNGSLESVRHLSEEIAKDAGLMSDLDWLVFPPSVYLQEVHGILAGKGVFVGIQNVSENQLGAFTGEIAVEMAEDIGCEYVLIGHSERRQLYQEDNKTVASKFLRVSESGLKPVVCVGETLEQREKNETEDVVRSQMKLVLESKGSIKWEDVVIAYEPVWAIGTGKTATPEEAQAVHEIIRSYFTEYHPNVAKNLRILYGGSVKSDNAAGLFAMPDIDGALIGGASLKATEFLEIGRICSS